MTGPTVRADLERQRRTGQPEVVYAAGKTPEQTVEAVHALARGRVRPIIVSRVDELRAAAVIRAFPGAQYHEDARMVVLDPLDVSAATDPQDVLLVTAGTSDLRVAHECRVAMDALGHPSTMLVDVGVAGLHRVLEAREQLARARVVVVFAGMEAALAPVIAGLVGAPIVGVPTSAGYGVAREGETALHALLTSCAPGIAVVNIDNGLGAAFLALRILHAASPEGSRAR